MKNENELCTLLDKPCDPNAQLSAEELHQLDFLFCSKPEDEYVTKWMRMDWEKEYKSFDKVNYERIADLVKQKTKLNTYKRLSFLQFFYRCAAILLLPVLGLSTYFIIKMTTSNKYTYTEVVEISDPQRVQSTIILLDGSRVTLKEGSRLAQNNNFNGNTREISLEGEAFFDIAHNPNKPFIIHTGSVKTTVLGTSFSIKAIPGEASITVKVAEGKVKVEDGSKLLATLEANQQFIHGIEAEHVQEKAINSAYEINWQPHDLIFSNMSFGDIAQELALMYGVHIIFENEELKQRRISALLDNRDSIHELLKFLCTSQQATCSAVEATYVITLSPNTLER